MLSYDQDISWFCFIQFSQGFVLGPSPLERKWHRIVKPALIWHLHGKKFRDLYKGAPLYWYSKTLGINGPKVYKSHRHRNPRLPYHKLLLKQCVPRRQLASFSELCWQLIAPFSVFRVSAWGAKLPCLKTRTSFSDQFYLRVHLYVLFVMHSSLCSSGLCARRKDTLVVGQKHQHVYLRVHLHLLSSCVWDCDAHGWLVQRQPLACTRV